MSGIHKSCTRLHVFLGEDSINFLGITETVAVYNILDHEEMRFIYGVGN